MAKILLVHGMNEEVRAEGDVLSRMSAAVLFALKGVAPKGASAPTKDDFALVYWGDLLRGPDDLPEAQAKDLVGDFQEWYTDYLRSMVRAIDERVDHNAIGNPKTLWGGIVHGFVYQTAIYMANGPARRIDPDAEPRFYDQVQAKFRKALTPDTRIVIGHSLGSVVAYEGLCGAMQGHRVHTLMTLGSPIGTPRLIYDRLRPPLVRDRRPWPGVRRWINVTAAQDWMTAPVPRITDLFAGGVEDQMVTHGWSLKPKGAHSFRRYTRHAAVRDALVQALEPAVGPRAESPARRYYLGVGVGAPLPGSGSSGRLQSVGKDLAQMREAFSGHLGYEPVELDLPPWSPDTEPTAGDFVSALQKWLGEVTLGSEDALVVYFSGHGYRSPSGQHYLCFAGFDERNPTKNGLTPGTLANVIVERARKPGQLWLIFDCCYAGAASAAAFEVFRDTLREEKSLAAAWLTASCGPYHPGYDGVFSRAFLDTVGGVRDLAELDRAIKARLGEQAPQEVRSVALLAGGVNLLARVGDAAAPAPAASPSLQAAPAPLRQSQPVSAPRAGAARRAPSGAAIAAVVLVVALGATALRLVTKRAPSPPTPAPTPIRTQTIPDAPAGMIRIAGGSIHLGVPNAEAQQLFRECRASKGAACGPLFERSIFARERRDEAAPPKIVTSYYLDRTEVTHAAYVAWLNANRTSFRVEAQRGPAADPSAGEPWAVSDARGDALVSVRAPRTTRALTPIRYAEGAFFVDDDWAQRPVVFVTWLGATRYCADQHKRLPLEEEWELAARGTTGRRYPWGDAAPAGCAQSVFGRVQDGVCRDEAAEPTPVGTSVGDVTAEGVRDLGGNVGEWTASLFRGPEAGPPCQAPLGGSCRVVRGGSFLDDASFLRGSARMRLPSDAVARDVGFRCARDLGGPT